MIEKKIAYFNIFFILLYTGKRNSGNGAGAILVGQGMGMCEEMHTTGKKFKLCATFNNDNYIDNNEQNHEIQTKSWNQCKIWKM